MPITVVNMFSDCPEGAVDIYKKIYQKNCCRQSPDKTPLQKKIDTLVQDLCDAAAVKATEMCTSATDIPCPKDSSNVRQTCQFLEEGITGFADPLMQQIDEQPEITPMNKAAIKKAITSALRGSSGKGCQKFVDECKKPFSHCCNEGGLSGGVIAGIIGGSVAGLITFGLLIWYFHKRK